MRMPTRAEPAVPGVTPRPAPAALTLLPAIGVSLSAFVLFAFRVPEVGHPLLAVSLIAAVLIDRELGRDLALIGVGVAIVSTTSVEADVGWPSFVRIGLASCTGAG